MQAHPLLAQAAQSHASDMASHRLFSHTGSDGSSVHMRTARIGYTSGKGVTENWVTTGKRGQRSGMVDEQLCSPQQHPQPQMD